MAAIYDGDNENPPDDINFIVHDKTPTSKNSLKIISFVSKHVNSMLNPLFFLY